MHKMGCTVFAVWEDLVEVRPKMITVMLAAAMVRDLRLASLGSPPQAQRQTQAGRRRGLPRLSLGGVRLTRRMSSASAPPTAQPEDRLSALTRSKEDGAYSIDL